MRVEFHSVSAFLEEIDLDPPPDKILRVSVLRRTEAIAPIKQIFIESTYLNRLGQLVRLVAYCGDDFGENPASVDAISRKEKIMAEIQRHADAKALEIRHGFLTEEPSR